MTTPEERFTAVFARCHRPVLAYAARRVDEPADAADIVAETFLVAWRRLDALPAGDAELPWLYGVARRVLANQLRGRRRRHALAQRLRDELDARLAGALARLGGDDRELLRLVAWEGLDNAQLAAALGLRPGTVRVRLHRARTRLAHALAEEGEPLGVRGPAAASTSSAVASDPAPSSAATSTSASSTPATSPAATRRPGIASPTSSTHSMPTPATPTPATPTPGTSSAVASTPTTSSPATTTRSR
jgi:RNA polymerase sigma-70 factor (ECF subfamily)